MFSSLSPKFHGAYLGAGTAAAISNVIIGLIQSYVTHTPLPAADVQLTYTLVGVILAGFGAWIMPSGKPAPVVSPTPAPPPSNVHVGAASQSYGGMGSSNTAYGVPAGGGGSAHGQLATGSGAAGGTAAVSGVTPGGPGH